MSNAISFRNATADDALFIAKGFHMAMLYDDAAEEQISNFALNICVREDVLYSWRNTIIAEVDGKCAGMLTAYDGQYYHNMRIRTMALVKQHLGVEFPGMEDEAVAGEYYLDSLAVMPEYRGRGIGRKLLEQGIENGKTLCRDVTLAVDPINDRAKKLYRSLGFIPSGTLFIFGHDYEKMIIRHGSCCACVELRKEYNKTRQQQMTIRKATLEDIPRMQEIFAIARRFMAETGNPNQWAETYPSVQQLTDDINSGDSYICLEDMRMVATFVLRGGNDPTYDKIYDGAWKNDNPYATIHRIASSGAVRGIFCRVMEYALQHYGTIRIDTHRDNEVMQNALAKAGFEYCGIIHCWNGDERLAYQYN